MKRIRPGKLILAAIALLAWPRARTQEPPELRILVPPNLTSGTLIDTSARISIKDSSILSWQICVSHEGLRVVSTTTAGTDFDRLSQGGFAESGIHPDGSTYFSIGALSFVEPVTLPAGTPEVLRARCLITRKDPGEIKILPRNGVVFPGDDRQFSNQILILGGDSVSLKTADKSYNIAGCAGFTIELKRGDGRDPGSPIEVRRGTEIEVEVGVKVASEAHLNPTGFSFGLRHDGAMLQLANAALLESITQNFVKTDGFARIESTEDGFAVAVLSSAVDPATLGSGAHAVARGSYAFSGAGQSGETLLAGFALVDDLPIGGVAVTSDFQPRDALPCETTKLDVSLVIGPDWWVRGDSNGDGKADLTDAIVTLQHLFLGGTADCERAMEVNLDGRVDISDPIALLAHLFLGGPAPPSPFPGCGTADDIAECGKFPCPAV